MRRFRALAALCGLLVAEGAALAVLRWSGHARWSIDYAHVSRWLDVTPPGDVAVAAVRLVLTVIVGWLALSTALFLVASATRIGPLIHATSLFTLPGIRRVVEGSVAVAMTGSILMRGGAAMAHTMPAGGWAPAPATAAPAPVAPGPPASAPAVAPPAVAPSVSAPGTWTVATDDNLWTIARAALAHVKGVEPSSLRSADIGPYWRAMCALNQRHLISGDVNLIYAGEELVLPPMPGLTAQAAVSPPAPVPAVPAVPAPPAAPTTLAPPTTSAAPTTLAPPTTEAEAPAVTAPAPALAPPASAPPTSAVTTTDAPTTTAAAVPDQPPAPPRAEGAVPVAAKKSSSGVPLGLAGAGLLAAGIAVAAADRRRRRARLHVPGQVVAPPPRAVEIADLTTAVAADVDGAAYVEAALRALGAVADPEEPVAPLAVILSEHRMEVVLAEPRVARPPFTGSGRTWVLDRRVTSRADLVEVAGTHPLLLPALTTFGRTDDGAEVLIDIEDPGLIAVCGPGAAELVTAAALQLATSPWPERASVVLVGFPNPPRREGVRAVAELDEVIEELAREAEETADLLRGTEGFGSTAEARAAGVAVENWIPTVVACLAPPPDHLARRLVSICSSPDTAGVAALVAGEMPDAPWTMTIAGGVLPLPHLEVAIEVPAGVSGEEASDVADLLDYAEAPPLESQPELEVPDLAPEVVEGAPTVESPPRPSLLVRVLGPPRVDGVEIQRSKGAEALIYLATHRTTPVDGDRLVERLWPGADPGTAATNLHTTLHTTRKVLGDDEHGDPYWPPLKGREKLYHLGPSVGTDLELLSAALERARSGGHVEDLREALGLVEGPPFDHVGKGYEWALAEGLVTRAHALVTDAAHYLAVRELAAGDPARSAWAATQGLRGSPGSEVLYRDLMAAQGAAGDLSGVETALAEVSAAAGDDDLDPETVAVYRSQRETLTRAG